eukprot:TRINITY_DN5365_c0_g1_i1.p1 TRINITY_DN5365_c0_g1~~TRINITY_DN5365_c0_g1_i1.p1  ORF type:complete len:1024 (-),score=201.00 TRINITY_DN5365_c0_g1_i1:140-3211(-)
MKLHFLSEYDTVQIYHQKISCYHPCSVSLDVTDFDYMVIPVNNAYGIFDEFWKSLLNRIVGTQIDHLLSVAIQDSYFGEVTPYTPVFIDVPKHDKPVKFCFISISRSPSMISEDFAYNFMWTGLSVIEKHITEHKLRGQVTVVFPHLTAISDIPPEAVCHQIYVALENFPGKTTFETLEEAEKETNKIISRTFDDKEEIQALIWSKELAERGLYTKRELDIVLDILTDGDGEGAVRELYKLLTVSERKRGKYTLSPDDISFQITQRKDSMEKVMDLIKNQKGVISVDKSEIELGSQIGNGNTSKIYDGTYKDIPVAVKVIDKSNTEELLREIALLTVVKNTYVVGFYGANITGGKPFLILEKMEGSLYELIHDKSFKMSEDIMYIIAIKAAVSMSAFHSYGLIHRDLKSLNLLISSSFEVKICDFGLSRSISKHKMTSNLGTISWIAPELLTNKKYTESVDIYSFGIILWELLTRSIPYSDLQPAQIPFSVRQGIRPTLPHDISRHEKYVKLMKQAWHKNEDKRPDFPKIVNYLKSQYRALVGKMIREGDAPSNITRIKRNTENSTTTFDVFYENGSLYVESDISSGRILSEESTGPLPFVFDDDMFTTDISRDVSSIYRGLSWNPKTGVIENSERFVLIFGKSLSDSLRKMLQNILDVTELDESYFSYFIFEMGYAVGIEDSKYVKENLHYTSPNEIIEALPTVCLCSGWGGMVITERNKGYNVCFQKGCIEKSIIELVMGYICGYLYGACGEKHYIISSGKNEFIATRNKKLSKKFEESFVMFPSKSWVYDLIDTCPLVPEKHRSKSGSTGTSFRKLSKNTSLLRKQESASNLLLEPSSEVFVDINSTLVLDATTQFSFMNKRCFLIRIESLLGIHCRLESMFHFVNRSTLLADLFLFEIGKAIGKDMVECYSSFTGIEEPRIQNILPLLGWGNASVRLAPAKDKVFLCSTSNSPECSKGKKRHCCLLPGVMLGMLKEDGLYFESKCCEEGCLFLLGKASSYDKVLKSNSIEMTTDEYTHV